MPATATQPRPTASSTGKPALAPIAPTALPPTCAAPRDATPTERIILALPYATVTFDPEHERHESFPYSVYDADGDCRDGYRTKGEAVREARELSGQAEAEARAERVEGLREAIESAVADCEDEDVLGKVLAMLRGE